MSFFSDFFLNTPGVLLCWIIDGANCIVSVFLAFFLVHWVTTGRLPLYLRPNKFLANLLCYLLVINFCSILFARTDLSCAIGGMVVLLLGTANYYVYRFKGTELAITDFFAIKTAKNVAKHYSLAPDKRIVLAWLVWFGFSTLQFLFHFPTKAGPWVIRGLALLAELALIAVFLLFTRHVRGTHWSNEGSQNYGYFLNFMIGVKGLFGLKPKGYQAARVEEICEKYRLSSSEEPSTEEKPDIIVIMNESFADLSVLGKAPVTNVPVLPCLQKIRENSISGYALTSVFGGTTANSEYEFLTGNTMAFFPYGSIPYQQFVHGETYSVVSELKRQGYYCMATHPYIASGWSRPTVYPAFGFDKITFEEAYPKKDAPRGYISDAEMYDYVIEQYETISNDHRLFLFGVTVQNHGDYANRSAMVENTVFIRDKQGQYPDADQYLTLLRRSDQALEKLISYFSKIDRRVILCFFGDHLPGLDPRFLRELHGGSFDTLDEQQKTKMVPFFIWSNRRLEEQDIGCTSFNYLATRVLELAGVGLSPYRRFLKKAEEEIPAINADGYYSAARKGFCPVDDAKGREAEYLRDYRMLVYHNAIDGKRLNRDVFRS